MFYSTHISINIFELRFLIHGVVLSERLGRGEETTTFYWGVWALSWENFEIKVLLSVFQCNLI